tara:strand:- start:455 stop:556 length:102 start_codon:yes stop_codon:yes gene_type:complete
MDYGWYDRYDNEVEAYEMYMENNKSKKELKEGK